MNGFKVVAVAVFAVVCLAGVSFSEEAITDHGAMMGDAAQQAGGMMEEMANETMTNMEDMAEMDHMDGDMMEEMPMNETMEDAY